MLIQIHLHTKVLILLGSLSLGTEGRVFGGFSEWGRESLYTQVHILLWLAVGGQLAVALRSLRASSR